MKVIKTLCMCALCILMFFESAQTINADYNTENEKTYYLEWYWEDSKHVHITRRLEFTVPYDISVYAIYTEGGPSHIAINFLHDGDNTTFTWQYTDHEFSVNHSYDYSHSDVNLINTQWWINASASQSVGLSFPCGDNYTTDLPLFDSKESVVDYITNGNTDGWLNKPDIDYGVEHDFASDNYRTDIPIPEVSNMDFNSFKLTNWKEEYFVDILIENRFLEVAIMNNTGNGWKKIFKPSGAKTYNWHYWNLLCHGVAYNQPDIDIPTLFGFDPQEYLIEDFKAWSEQHPDLSTIDGYDFTMIAQKNDYKERHVYDPESALTDEQQLRNSGQGMCIYWIRYSLEDGSYGQWVKYTVHDYDVNAKDNDNWEDKTTVSTQIVGVNKDTGRVEHSNPITGTVSKEDGALDYTGVAGNTSDLELDSAFSYFIEMVRALMDGVGQMPEFIARMFSFFPQWFINFLCASLFAVIILRIAGR